MQDANYNVIGLVNAAGVLTERYEYTPYGRRQVFSRGWQLCDAKTGKGGGESATTVSGDFEIASLFARYARGAKVP